MSNQQNQPVFRMPRLGNVQAAVFERSNNNGTWFSTSITESYKDGQGNWQSTSSFSTGELGNVAKAAEVCRDWIIKQELKRQAQ